MKINSTKLIISSICVFILTTAFQCSSPEMTSAKLYLQRKDSKKAAEQLENEVKKNPKNAEAYYLLGQIRFDEQDFKSMRIAFQNSLAAENKYEKEIKNYNTSAWARKFNEGVDALNNAIEDSTIDRAIVAFEMAYYILPESTMNARNLGLAHYKRGNMTKAVEYLTDTFNKDQDDLSIRVIGRIYTDNASKFKNQYLEENSELINQIKNINSIQVRTKAEDVKYSLAQPTSINKIPKTKKEEWNYEKLGLKFTIEGGVVSAINKSFDLKPDTTLLMQSRGEFSKAVEILNVGVAKFPEDSEISEMLMNAYIGAERNIEARKLLEERVVKYPESKFDHYNFGVFLLKDNDYKNAIKHFESAIKIDAAFNASMYNLAASYVNWGVSEQERIKKSGKEGDKSYNDKYKAALPYLEKIISETPNDVQILELLGQVYANLGNSKKAEEYYKKADDIRSGKN